MAINPVNIQGLLGANQQLQQDRMYQEEQARAKKARKQARRRERDAQTQQNITGAFAIGGAIVGSIVPGAGTMAGASAGMAIGGLIGGAVAGNLSPMQAASGGLQAASVINGIQQSRAQNASTMAAGQANATAYEIQIDQARQTIDGKRQQHVAQLETVRAETQMEDIEYERQLSAINARYEKPLNDLNKLQYTTNEIGETVPRANLSLIKAPTVAKIVANSVNNAGGNSRETDQAFLSTMSSMNNEALKNRTPTPSLEEVLGQTAAKNPTIDMTLLTDKASGRFFQNKARTLSKNVIASTPEQKAFIQSLRTVALNPKMSAAEKMDSIHQSVQSKTFNSFTADQQALLTKDIIKPIQSQHIQAQTKELMGRSQFDTLDLTKEVYKAIKYEKGINISDKDFSVLLDQPQSIEFVSGQLNTTPEEIMQYKKNFTEGMLQGSSLTDRGREAAAAYVKTLDDQMAQRSAEKQQILAISTARVAQGESLDQVISDLRSQTSFTAKEQEEIIQAVQQKATPVQAPPAAEPGFFDSLWGN